MKKKILSAILSMSVLLTLTACSDGSAPSSPLDLLNSGKSSTSEATKSSSTTSEVEKPKYPEIPDEKPITDFTYIYNMEKGGIEITDYNGSDMKVRIPDTIEGEKVTYINCEFPNSITQIEFPDSVTEITQLPKSIKYFNIPAEYKADSSFGTPQLEMVKTHDEVFLNEKENGYGGVSFSDSFLRLSSTLYIRNDLLYDLIGHHAEIDAEIKFTFRYRWRNISTVVIMDGVTTIGEEAFYNCEGLTSVTIPNSVTEIGERAFSGCTGLTSITIPNSVTTIGREAFSGCTGLTSVTIPNSVTYIGYDAFYYCTGLTSVTIPNSVTEIGANAFAWCWGLTSVTIPDSVTEIGGGAFRGCEGLTTINVDSNNQNYTSKDGVLYNKDMTALIQCPAKKQGAFSIPNSVTEIYYYAFEDCDGLTTINVDSNNQNYTSKDGVLYNKDMTTIVAYPYGRTGSFAIPNSVTTIGYLAFYDCKGLTSVTIPNSVTEIGESAFFGCSGLTSVTIPNSVTEIGYKAFSYCTGLTSITIPDSVTTIGEEAFFHCTTDVIYKGAVYTPKTSGNGPYNYDDGGLSQAINGN